MFCGRERELKLLDSLLEKKSASLVVIRGRRRVGKSRLVEEFTRRNKMRSLVFSGILPVKGTTAASQREEFARQLEQKRIYGVNPSDWGMLFWHLAKQTKTGRIVIFLDEISWMGSKDFDFLGKLKNAWDLHFKQNPKLILILCGSVSSWIEEEVLNNPAFLGRITMKLTLDELTLHESSQFWDHRSSTTSAYDKLKFLSVSGGIPRYLEELNPSQPAETNIRRMCFQKEGFLFDEFKHIFADLFDKKSKTYEGLVRCLIKGPLELSQIYKKLNIKKSSKTSGYLDDLILSGFVSRDYTWNIKDGKDSKLSQYRLRDNYLRFYLKWVYPNKSKIERDEFSEKPLKTLPGWDSIMALQFENLVLHNRKEIWKLLHLQPSEIITNSPFFQKQTTSQAGCQIDYMIQTSHQFLYLCEIKFSKNTINSEVIDEVKEKIRRLKRPKNFSVLPVLIYAGELSEDVIDSGFFAKIIDFGELL